MRNHLQVIKLLKKPPLRVANIEKRLQFAENALRTPNFLRDLVTRTIWSDETTVRSMPQGQEVYFRCHTSVNKEDLPVNGQVQGGGFSVMFWGCFSLQGVGPLVALDGHQNQHTYKELLGNYLLPEMEIAKKDFGEDFLFMQDNAPCHKTKLISEFLAQNNIKTLK